MSPAGDVAGAQGEGLVLRPAIPQDWAEIWPFWHKIVAAASTYTWAPQTDEPQARDLWMLPPPAEVWVAESAGSVVGSAVLKPNQPGQGSHVAHAAFMVDPTAAGQGIGRALAERILSRAGELGYLAMQFNAVVADNPRGWTLEFPGIRRDRPGARRLPPAGRHVRRPTGPAPPPLT